MENNFWSVDIEMIINRERTRLSIMDNNLVNKNVHVEIRRRCLLKTRTQNVTDHNI